MIKFVKGDLFEALTKIDEKSILIPHVCNNISKWGAGFVVPLGKTFPQTKQSYLSLGKVCLSGVQTSQTDLPLGYTDFVVINDKIAVANMIAQKGIGGDRPLRYNALATCMDQVGKYALQNNKEIFAPFFGCGLAKGNPFFIQELIKDSWINLGIDVTIFYLPNSLPSGWSPS